MRGRVGYLRGGGGGTFGVVLEATTRALPQIAFPTYESSLHPSAFHYADICRHSVFAEFDADDEMQKFKEDLIRELDSLQRLKRLYERLQGHNKDLGHNEYLVRASEKFQGELRGMIAWLENKKNHSTNCNTSSKQREPFHPYTKGKGLSLSQRLRWPLIGKKKVQRFLRSFEQYKDYAGLQLLMIQR